MCFQKDNKTAQAARCIKSRIMLKVIDTFEQHCVVLKVMLQTPRLKYNVHTIVIDQPLSKNYIYEHKYLEKSKNIQTSW